VGDRKRQKKKTEREIDRQRARVKTFVESILYAESILTDMSELKRQKVFYMQKVF